MAFDYKPILVGTGVGLAESYFQRRDVAAKRWNCATKQDKTIFAAATSAVGLGLVYIGQRPGPDGTEPTYNNKVEYGHSLAISGLFILTSNLVATKLGNAGGTAGPGCT